MKHKVVILMMVLLLAGASTALAGNSLKVGTAGAQELLIPIGARSGALGGAVTASSYGTEAIFWNPAGLASLRGTEVMFTHLPYLADINVNTFAGATSIEDFGTIALSARVVAIGDIEETTEQQPEGTGSVFSPTFTVVGLSYARTLTAAVEFGISANFIHESVFEVAASGVSFDLGVTYRPNWRGLALGIVLKNYGPDMKFDGPGFGRSFEDAGQRRVFFDASPFELPAYINIGMSYDAIDQDRSYVALMGNFRSNNFAEDLWQGGVEYTYDQNYTLRAGYNYSNQEAYLYGFSFGGGLGFDLGEETRLILEYAWMETEVFDDNQFFTARLQF